MYVSLKLIRFGSIISNLKYSEFIYESPIRDLTLSNVEEETYDELSDVLRSTIGGQ